MTSDRYRHLRNSESLLTNTVGRKYENSRLRRGILNFVGEIDKVLQGSVQRTPRFGRGIASGGEGVQWWGERRRTAVYVPFSVYTMAWSGEQDRKSVV